ncbi:hypothetical protein [Cellulomonas sp. HZM]|uniref:hypothetical protein n=1 Tax=Cellulomonas sp. HZM TaxID=1454010 RepID=UPI0004936ED4|nr:hypothetical protein [Cellulomonas sp. HZM]
MDRISRPYWLRATGSVVPWPVVLRGQVGGAAGRVSPVLTHVEPGTALLDVSSLKDRGGDVALRWQCNPELGVPFGPFTVWVGRPRPKQRKVTVVQVPHDDGLTLRLPVLSAWVTVDAQVVDPSKPVGIVGTYRHGGLSEALGATAQSGAGGGRVTLALRTSGITRVLLVNGTDPVVSVVPLQTVIDDGGWKPFEVVGLPAPDPWGGTAYDTSKQGLVSAPTSPWDAAQQRLDRGGPPLGYVPFTPSGLVLSPPWRAPDTTTLLKEIEKDLLPRIDRLYRPSLTPADQAALADSPPVDPPSTTDGRTSSLSTTATLSPLSLLTLPASADPFLALATGFGTAYRQSDLPDAQGLEYLVTAEYPDTPVGTGPIAVAAYVPVPQQHVATTTPSGLTSRRSGLLSPEHRDDPWRETVRVQWDRVPGSVAMGRPTAGLLASSSGGSPAAVLAEDLPAGDRRPLVLVPDGVKPSLDWARTSMVDPDETIPLGSGGRHVTYPVAVQDVFGVWSPWAEVSWDGTEPAPPGPRIIGVSLTSSYAGSPTCAATMVVEVSVDWDTRTPTALTLASVLWRTTSASAPPPAGVDPVLPAPAGAFRRDVALTFVGDALTPPAGVTVDHLDESGEVVVAPGAAQGAHGRRYRVTIPVPSLDFSSTPRWGAQVWARTTLAVVPDAGWQPDPAHPALAGVASPVPIPPILPPPPPGVPMGSTPDASGHSHVRVHWSVASGAPLDARKGIVVWECAETALRQSAGLAQRAPDGTLPGVRLQQLWDAYDAMNPTQRRATFRRIQELPATARESDVALPTGSTDIHLFTVTTLSDTGVGSDWPSDSPAHLVLQAVTPPRLRQPGPPRVRSVIGAAGTVTLSLTADSDVPVSSFLLYRTRSADAAMRAETMGPAFAIVPAVAPAPGAAPDPASGLDVYTASWSGGFDPSWDDWNVRAVAVPVDTVPVAAVRGVPSLASDVVTVRVRPDGPPDLAPLVATVFGGGHDGILVTSSTSAPVRLVADGPFRLSATAGPLVVDPTDLRLVPAGPVVLADGEPPEAATALVARSGARASGRTPLALWFTRPVATDPVDVALTLVDPLGRVTTQSVTVPGYAPDPPTLTIIDVSTVVGRFVLVRASSDAALEPGAHLTVTVSAPRRVLTPFPIPGSRTLAPVLPTLPVLPVLPGRGTVTLPVSLDIALVDIPQRARLGTDPIQVTRASDDPPYEYDVAVRVAAPFVVRLRVTTADGRTTQVSRSVT